MVGNESNEKSPCPGTGSREGIVDESIFRVLLVNDDATPMEFVVKVLVDVFQKTHAEAVRIMFTTHHMGKGTCGVYTRPDAERLVDRVAALAHRNKHPLRCVMEPDALEEPITCDIPVALKESHVLTQQGSLGDLPSIVLEAGGGCPRQGWALVQERLARRSLVVSYDRAGLGWNTEWPYDVSAAGVATRLATLLVRAAIPSPHLLVGHSLGGLFIQYYAAKHPREVAGLVLVDPTPADRSHDCGERLFAPGGLLWDPFSTRGRELAALSTTLLLVHRHPIPPEMPVLVVTAGTLLHDAKSSLPADKLAEAHAWLAQHHKDTAARSFYGRHVLMPEADHVSIVSKPEHATELAEHILDFAEAFCRTRRL